jgi:hypothetical protein
MLETALASYEVHEACATAVRMMQRPGTRLALLSTGEVQKLCFGLFRPELALRRPANGSATPVCCHSPG